MHLVYLYLSNVFRSKIQNPGLLSFWFFRCQYLANPIHSIPTTPIVVKYHSLTAFWRYSSLPTKCGKNPGIAEKSSRTATSSTRQSDVCKSWKFAHGFWPLLSGVVRRTSEFHLDMRKQEHSRLRRVIIGGAKVSDRAKGGGEIRKRGKFMRSKIYAHEGWGAFETNFVSGTKTGGFCMNMGSW